jgi:DNA polymerase III gamma/tau subunit
MNTSDFRSVYRPKKFAEAIGNKWSIQTLKNIVISNRIPNGILFHGHPGTGKSCLSYVFVKALNCLNFKEDVCDVCENCLLMEKYYPHGSWLADFHDCTLINENHLEDLIKRYFNLFPQNRVDKRIHVFDEFQRARPSFQEKLLRQLDTNPNLLLIFLLIDASHVEEAFRQRVLVLKTERPEIQEVIPWLRRICSLEGIGVKDVKPLKDLAIAAELLPRECQSLLQKISYLSNTLTTDLVKQVSKDNRSVHEDASTPILIE